MAVTWKQDKFYKAYLVCLLHPSPLGNIYFKHLILKKSIISSNLDLEGVIKFTQMKGIYNIFTQNALHDLHSLGINYNWQIQ